MAKRATRKPKQAKFLSEQKGFNEMAKAFGTARMAKLSGYAGKSGGISTGTAREAEKLYLGVIGYAQKYGNAEQVAKAKKLNPAKLRWMYMNKLFKTEEVFSYDGDVATPNEYYDITNENDEVVQQIRGSLNLLFYRYDTLNKEANRQDRERRANKKGAA